MKTIHKTIELDNASQIIRLRNISDIHLGSVYCNRSMLKSVIDDIAHDSNYYWFGGGDYAEFIDYADHRRFRANELDLRLHGKNDIIGEEITMLGEYFSPISKKCIAFVDGNHEIAASKYYNRDIIRQFTDVAGIDYNKYLGFRGFIVVHFKLYDKVRFSLTFYLTHGTGSSKMASGHVLYLNKFFQNYSADVFMAGHRHVCLSIENSRIVPRGSGSELRTQHALLSGSFLSASMNSNTTTNYADHAEYVPASPGGYEIVINVAKRGVSIERVYV